VRVSLEKVKDLLEDVVNLEINTILVESITGRKMPSHLAAFIEVTSAWVYQLKKIIKRLVSEGIIKVRNSEGDILSQVNQCVMAEDHSADFLESVIKWEQKREEIFDTYTNGERSFLNFAEEPAIVNLLAVTRMNRLRSSLENHFPGFRSVSEIDNELFRLLRIQRRIYLLLEAVKKQNGKLEIRQQQELRRLWELKDGYIFAQNIVQLDGDIITRCNLRLKRDHRVKDRFMDLLAFHQRNVEIGISNWQFLVQTIGALSKSMVSGFKKLFFFK
ncbi:MAG: hypothetical protein KAJ10_07850, partial [Thermodesulfovibrionia bacterium]|nr:hypothetical protein [Thermodesulfovibrionia bacterium]